MENMEKVSITGVKAVVGNSTFELTHKELLSALWKSVGLWEVRDCNLYSSEAYWENTGTKLVEMKNINYHGSPHYEPTGREITSPIKVKLYSLLEQLETLILKREITEDKPLELQEFAKMAGKPVYCPCIHPGGVYGVIKYETLGNWAGVPFLVGVQHIDGVAVDFEYNIQERQLKCYKIGGN